MGLVRCQQTKGRIGVRSHLDIGSLSLTTKCALPPMAALRDLRDPKARKPLSDVIQDPVFDVRQAAGGALRKLEEHAP